ncbi:alpha/beta hydrolase family protein [Rubricoccus marinus]|uniref:Serine aminopeptidase S33 domain-containing protein n=1 Tax=Rubricoccus marinus TaxID=716817 RepID=A0A259TYA8_9BACT|nr:alpha/beta hydrolase [Rubricoccus marinus]OZC02691.1 hypothetical protein BSZ36_06700 [Rubricoccus marinus]
MLNRFLLLVCLFFASAAAAQDLSGSWRGPLVTPGGTLTLVLHLTPEASGGYTAAVDSPDQGVRGLGATATATGDTLTVTVGAVGARYVATASGDTMTGTFSQGGGSFPLTLTRGDAPEAAVVDPSATLAPLVGEWNGVLGGALPLVLTLSPGTSPDTLLATLDSPSQEAFGIPTAGAWIESGRLQVSIPVISGGYTAEIRGDSLVGTWDQGFAQPLTLTRASGDRSEVRAPNRPQTPVGPFPYREESLSVVSTPEVTLAGTLTIPEGSGPFRAVVLVSGSGPQDRDETILGHKAFALWADRLAREGVATYRYDDRGTAESTGEWDRATIADFSADTAAAVRALIAREDIASVGVMGHSEGGYVAPRVASLVPETEFVVLLAGPGVHGRDVYVEQQRIIAESQGTPSEVASLYADVVRTLIEPFTRADDATPLADRRARGEAAARARLAEAPEATRLALLQGQDPTATFTALLDFVSTPGIGSFLAFDPAEDLRALRVPALAVFGGKDMQVPPSQSAGPMEQALAASQSPTHAVVTFAGVNHLFQPSETGRVEEYGRIETTIDDEVLGFVTRWISGLDA